MHALQTSKLKLNMFMDFFSNNSIRYTLDDTSPGDDEDVDYRILSKYPLAKNSDLGK